MSIGAIDHVAVVVRSIDASLPGYARLFGMRPIDAPRIIDGQRVRICLLPTGPAPAARIELIEPLDDESGVARYLAARGEGLHHVCLRSDDLPADLDRLAAQEARLLDEEPRAGADGRVAFVHPSTLSGVLWELLEPETSRPG